MSTTETTEDLEVRVYNNYRAVLRSFKNQYGSRDSRAAARRQEARKQTVERYNVPFAEVKRIVAKYDLINGVTHEHTPQYYRDMEYRAAVKAFAENPVSCSCGSDKLVRVRVEPYSRLIGIYRLYVSCFLCDFTSNQLCGVRW